MQLSVLKKKEAKSVSYHQKSTSKVPHKDGDHASESQRKISSLLKKKLSSSSSSSTDDTIILSDSEIMKDPPAAEDAALNDSQIDQDFPQVPPHMTNMKEGN